MRIFIFIFIFIFIYIYTTTTTTTRPLLPLLLTERSVKDAERIEAIVVDESDWQCML